jgi:dynein heavy chain
LKFDNHEVVSGMVSPEKEHVDFGLKINVNEGERKGNVEKWLLEIEAAMIKCLK